MKKYFVYLVIFTTLVALSCKSTPSPSTITEPEPSKPPETTETTQPTTAQSAATQPSASSTDTQSRPQTNGPVTQQEVDNALDQIYGTHRTNLDYTQVRQYVVINGDTLSEITRMHYENLTDVGKAGTRNGFYYPILMLASPDCGIVDPDLIFPGMNLNIPDIKRNLANPTARQAIKECLKQVSSIYSLKGKPEEEEGLLKLADSL